MLIIQYQVQPTGLFSARQPSHSALHQAWVIFMRLCMGFTAAAAILKPALPLMSQSGPGFIWPLPLMVPTINYLSMVRR